MNEEAVKILNAHINSLKRSLDYEKESYTNIISSISQTIIDIHILETKLAGLQESLKLLKNA